MPEKAPSRIMRFWKPILLIAILLIAGFTRTETIGSRPIWYDEIFTDIVTRKAESVGDVWKTATVDGWEHPPLHYLIAYLFRSTVDSLAMMRAPSAIGGVGSLLFVILIGNLLFGTRTGITAGLIGALSIYHINYSMDARPYTLLLFFVSGQFYFLLSYLKSGRWSSPPLFVLFGAGSLYTHHTALTAQATLGLVTLCVLGSGLRTGGFKNWRESIPIRRSAVGLLMFAVIGFIYLPQLTNFMKFAQSGKLDGKWSLWPSPQFFYDLFSRWGAGTGIAATLVGACFLIALVRLVAARNLNSSILLWFFAPILLLTIVPFSKFFDIRFIMVGLPAFFILIALGMVTLSELSAKVLSQVKYLAHHQPNLASGVLAVLLSIYTIEASRAYLIFRETKSRCSNFFHTKELLTQNNGFCREHILLNTFIPEDEYILKDRGAADYGSTAAG